MKYTQIHLENNMNNEVYLDYFKYEPNKQSPVPESAFTNKDERICQEKKLNVKAKIVSISKLITWLKK